MMSQFYLKGDYLLFHVFLIIKIIIFEDSYEYSSTQLTLGHADHCLRFLSRILLNSSYMYKLSKIIKLLRNIDSPAYI